eukprot:CAMPEP_0181243944 /NCGR_PEP_ID=MMETSP1096-20121128/42569_1 /TAXON_ID=156174 ORGANISM="Chrysochromulina ericina, Strain CCMP281" /NCGR_SAMPLE_ID=MMETSP1096 /ASSEMBLY_ACC=CAM_ASM_000453 /LENGTH=104 /DNA_ID=CAMNT_0023340405 /DNA_START=221 /DNA_END=534 /DNA_ORIENTATION=-
MTPVLARGEALRKEVGPAVPHLKSSPTTITATAPTAITATTATTATTASTTAAITATATKCNHRRTSEETRDETPSTLMDVRWEAPPSRSTGSPTSTLTGDSRW